MRPIAAICAALSFVAFTAVGSDADAASARKHKEKQYPSRSSTAGNGDRAASGRQPAASTGDWYPHDTSQLPFGSKLWWDQKAREGGGDHN